jgi:hypothetical protein
MRSENVGTTNPKDLVGRLKPPMHLIPAVANVLESQVFGLGSVKYGPYNWREHSVAASVYIAAMYRHVAAWFDGEESDPESAITHLAHARACLAIILDAQSCGKLVDDRPTKGNAAAVIRTLTKAK